MTIDIIKKPNLEAPRGPWGRLPRSKHGTTSRDGFGSSENPDNITASKHRTETVPIAPPVRTADAG